MISLHIDKQSYSRKPEGKEIAIISKRITNNICETDNLYEVADLISNKGCTWCPSVFNGTRTIENFVCTNLIALDFDKNITFDEVSEKAERYMLPIAFAYETFSSINKNKFRVVFLLDKTINNINEFNVIMSIFMKIFSGCDTACKDVSRMFFGGKRLLHYQKTTINADIIMMNFELFLKDTYGNTHYKERLKTFMNKQIQDGKNSSLVVYNKTINEEKLPKNKQYRKNTLTNILNCCKLYREFTEDSVWLYHNQLFGLITNLIHVESGERTFLEHISKSSFDTYKKDWRFYINYYKKNNYSPEHCNKFCPYYDTCNHGKTILETATVKRNEIVALKRPEYTTLENAREELLTEFHNALDADDNKIHIIKAQTAIGKTHMYINYLKNIDRRCIIAVPTNILKNEVYESCIAAGINVVMTPSIQELKDDIPEDVYRLITNLYNTGRHKKVRKYIGSLKDEFPALADYLKKNSEVKDFDGHIITTHHRILFSRKKYLKKYNLIIDEDILKTMIKNQIEISIDEIEEMLYNDVPSDIRNHLKNILTISEEKGLFTITPLDECNTSANFNLEALVTAEKFYSDGETIRFYHTPKLKKLKYIVLSATADEYIYKHYFGSNRVVFHLCSTAAYKGKLIQYVNHSYSRRYISNSENIYDSISDITGDVPVITFKKFSTDEYKIYFGNSEGCNCMKGQDIAVVGTPHIADFLYKLMAYQMGYNGMKDKLIYHQVEHNGFKFWFYTYKNELMRRIQFWMIESELEQSVGRARLLREDCTVYLFSDFPLMQSNIQTTFS